MKRVDSRPNLGVLLFASLFLDVLLGLFVLAGVEQVHVAAPYRDLTGLTFTFPYSHSLVAALLWSALAFAPAWLWFRLRLRLARPALAIAATVFSHWPLDVLVHVPEVPLAGEGSPHVGLGLYGMPAVEALLEVLLVAAGLALYLRATPDVPRSRRITLVVVMTLVSALTFAGALSTAPPAPMAAAVTWVAEAPLLAAVAFWVDRGTGSEVQVRT
jgi:hypothetical protein